MDFVPDIQDNSKTRWRSFLGQSYFRVALGRHFNVITDANKWRLSPQIARH